MTRYIVKSRSVFINKRVDKGTENNNKTYYAQFNNKQEKITRDKRGVALIGRDNEKKEEREYKKRRALEQQDKKDSF